MSNERATDDSQPRAWTDALRWEVSQRCREAVVHGPHGAGADWCSGVPEDEQPLSFTDTPTPTVAHNPMMCDMDACRRRVWAAALRWEASQYRATDPATAFGEITAARHYATVLEVDAARIEAGHLTPWHTDTTGEDTEDA